MRTSQFRGLDYLHVFHVRVKPRDILFYCAREQLDILRHVTNMLPQ